MGYPNDYRCKEIRDLALQVATDMVAQQSLQGLSLRKVASVMGYSVESLQSVFHNLDDLILQVNIRTIDELYTVISTTEQQCPQPDTCILAFGHVYLQFAIEQPHRWRAIFEHHLDGSGEMPGWYQKKIARLFSLVEKPLRKFIPTLDPYVCAQATRALWASVHGICILALTKKFEIIDAEPVQNLIELLISSYLAGLKTQYSNTLRSNGTSNQ